MAEKGVDGKLQDRIVEAIQSFALYGFPESHAISFALLAYASAWLKVHRAVEFYVSLLNNQPMGFYSCATLVRDAKRHGIRVLPVSVEDSDLGARVGDEQTLRLGLKQVSGLSRESAQRIVEERSKEAWKSLDDFRLRCRLKRDEARALAKIGALNGLAKHRREALWRIEKPVEYDLFTWSALTRATATPEDAKEALPLEPMNARERLQADYAALGLTVGPHPMSLLRSSLPQVWRACDLAHGKDGETITVAGLVICRQRPSTAKGHVFVSLEDETGIANVFVPAPTFEAHRFVVNQEPFLRVQGRLQNRDQVNSVYALNIEPLPFDRSLMTQSHDFH
jgi:error-prone DNA polymerase